MRRRRRWRRRREVEKAGDPKEIENVEEAE